MANNFQQQRAIVRDKQTGELSVWTMEQVLEEVNRPSITTTPSSNLIVEADFSGLEFRMAGAIHTAETWWEGWRDRVEGDRYNMICITDGDERNG